MMIIYIIYTISYDIMKCLNFMPYDTLRTQKRDCDKYIYVRVLRNKFHIRTSYLIYKMFSYSYIYINFFYSRSLTSQNKNDL